MAVHTYGLITIWKYTVCDLLLYGGAYLGPYYEHRYFREIMKMDNFACIKIHVLSITGTLWYYKNNFLGVHIFTNI